MIGRMILIASVLSILLPSVLRADAQADFEQLFGADARKVAASADTRDDAEFAATLLQAAKTADNASELQAVILEKVYEFGIKNVHGCEAAVEAMTLLSEKAPARKDACREKMIVAYQLLYTQGTGATRQRAGTEMVDLLVEAGDRHVEAHKAADAIGFYQRALSMAGNLHSNRVGEIQAKIREAAAHQRTDQKADQLRARLEKDPQDLAARTELIQMDLVEYDDVAAALKLLDKDIDETLRTYVPLAAKEVSEVPEAVCLELAEWYRKLSDSATPQGKANALTRAKDYYAHFIEIHAAASDVAMLKAKKSLSEVEDALKALAAKVGGTDGGFAAVLKNLRVLSEGHNVGDRVGILYKGKVLVFGSSQETVGLTMVTFNHGQPSAPVSFDTSTKRSAAEAFAEAVTALPAGTVVVLAVRHDGSGAFTEKAQAAIRSIGGKIGLLGHPAMSSYYCIGRKGMSPGEAVEKLAQKRLVYPPDARFADDPAAADTPARPAAPPSRLPGRGPGVRPGR